MHYFRYRPYSELSLKELMYSEIYFASTTECNDPFDSKAFYSFKPNKEKWIKTIEFTCKQFNIQIPQAYQTELGEYISAQCPLTFDEIIKTDLLKNFISEKIKPVNITFLNKALHEILKVYSPSSRYFVSFSRNKTEPLMWSHYADKHQGFCLIYKSINGKMLLNPNRKKHQVNRKTKNGLAAQMSFSFPDEFEFKNINYKLKVKNLDAFLHMPAFVSGQIDNEKKQQKIYKIQQSHYEQKARNWSYEKESRLILPPPPSWLAGEHIDYTKQERLFHHEPAQLVGIIYGARMTDEKKQRIREILRERKNYDCMTLNYKRFEFSFIEFQAKLSTHQRHVEVDALNILSYKPMPPSDKDFDRLYSEWKDGYGWEKDKNRSSKVRVE